MILVFKDFLQINSTTDFGTLCKKVSRFSLEKFSSHSAENFCRGTLLCFTKWLVSKKFMDKRGGVSKFSVENFLSHSAENFRRGTPKCSTNFGYRKMLGINRKRIWQVSDSNPEPSALEPCCPKPTAVIYF